MTSQVYTNNLFAFDIGSNSIGWAVLKLNDRLEAVDIINAGARIFSDGREAQSGEPLAVKRRALAITHARPLQAPSAKDIIKIDGIWSFA